MASQTEGLVSILSDIEDFFDPRKTDIPVDLHDIAHAVEDLPEDVQVEGAMVLSTPTGSDLQHRVFGVLENSVIAAYGELETVRVLHFLSQYPVKAYTYELSSTVSRGQRADKAKVIALARQGYGAIINLCAETPAGDAPLIKATGVPMQAFHFGIVDGTAPTVEQAVQLLQTVRDVTAKGIRVYMHCEAGKARTGVMSAVVRMGLMGWSMDDALAEAKNFGCSAPMQIRFIQDFGRMLQENWLARAGGGPAPHPEAAGFPALRPGSVKATAKQLSITLDQVVASETHGLEVA
jgi:hypothetical protein